MPIVLKWLPIGQLDGGHSADAACVTRSEASFCGIPTGFRSLRFFRIGRGPVHADTGSVRHNKVIIILGVPKTVKTCDTSRLKRDNKRYRQDLPKCQGSGGNQPDQFLAKQRKLPFPAGISGKVVSTGSGSSGT